MADVIIVSAGQGKRMSVPPMATSKGRCDDVIAPPPKYWSHRTRSKSVWSGNVPKPYIKLKGASIIALTLKVFNEIKEIDNIIIVTHPDWINFCSSEIVEKLGFKKVKLVINGGPKRQDSVKMGLDAISSTPMASPDTLLIHDAVRPFITPDFISHLIEMGAKYGAAVPALPATNTIKLIENGFVLRTLQRNNLYEIQTPQVFKYNIIKEAYEKAYSCGFYGTDDAELVERIHLPVKIVPGLPSNIKITTPEDLLYGERLMKMIK